MNMAGLMRSDTVESEGAKPSIKVKEKVIEKVVEKVVEDTSKIKRLTQQNLDYCNQIRHLEAELDGLKEG